MKTMMKRLSLGGLAVAVGVGLYAYSNQSTSTSTEKATSKPAQTAENDPSPPSPTPSVAVLPTKALTAQAPSQLNQTPTATLASKVPRMTFEERYTEVIARRNGARIEPQALQRAMQETAVWTAVTEAPEHLDLSVEEQLDGREFIDVSALKLESLVKGDTVELPIGQLKRTYEAKVEQIRSDDNGRSVTWSGSLVDVPAPNGFTLTRGRDLIVGGISTPHGHFEVQAQGSDGWIVSSATLFSKGVDQQVIVPEELIESPPNDVVHLPAETFGDDGHDNNNNH